MSSQSPAATDFRAIDPAAHTLVAGDLRAVFLPGLGMLGASLCHQGAELMGRVEDISGFARTSRTCGIPLLHPWANRLAGTSYEVVGQAVTLDANSALLHLDNGLPIHGVPWGQLVWQVVAANDTTLKARLDWNSAERLTIFPFPHHLEMSVELQPASLTVTTTLVAGEETAVPVSFGFHPYFTLPGVARSAWQLELPAMRRLLLNQQHIPTGEEVAFPAFTGKLAEQDFDDGFVLLDEATSFSVAGGGRQITVECLEGYPYAQVFAPLGKAFIALEPMTAPTNALVTGQGLRLVQPGASLRATFRIGVEAI
jgi:galactose mutarotase-like enzyme